MALSAQTLFSRSLLQRCSSLERPLSATSNSRNSNASNSSARQCPSPIPAHVAKGTKRWQRLHWNVIFNGISVKSAISSFSMTCGWENLWNCIFYPACLVLDGKITPETRAWGKFLVFWCTFYVCACPTWTRCHDFHSSCFSTRTSEWLNL